MPRKNESRLAWCGLVLLALAVAGCGAKEAPPPPAPVKAAKPVQKKVSSAALPPQREQFDFTGKKDPFRSYVVAAKAKLPLPPISNVQLPIQKFEVDQFKIIGIVTGLTENRALVLDPTGKSYVLRGGALIGPHNGKVLAITQTAIEVTEQYREENGAIRNRVVKLALPRKE